MGAKKAWMYRVGWLAAVLAGTVGDAVGAEVVHYFYTDQQGSVIAEADAQGNIVARYDYRPYGAPVSTTSDGPGYTGHVMDSDTSLIYMKARYYDAESMRFLSVDPKPVTIGDTYDFDRYGYADGNPMKFVDPDGLYACGENTTKSSCAKIDRFVKTMRSSMAHLPKGSREYKSLSAVANHIGTSGDNNGVTLDAGSLGKNVVAQANSSTLMTIDVSQVYSLSAPYAKYNPGMSPSAVADAFGAASIAHEGQHQLDYLNPSIGYPSNRVTELRTEMNAYRTEVGVSRGLGVSTDMYAPGARQEDIDARIMGNANDSTNYWCERNGC